MESETSSLPNLLCEEDQSSLNENYDEKDEDFEFCSVSKSDCEYIEILFQRETNFRPDKDEYSDVKGKTWFRCARSNAIKWILDKSAVFGYHHRTAYLSVIYFDRFLTKTRISDGKLLLFRLLSIACLSLAAKMEESEVRALTEYSVEGEGFRFEGSSIQRMELLVLNALEWKMISATPFTYLNYFAAKFCGESRHKELVIRANELILAIMEEINVAKHRPSIIAAAAVLAAQHDYPLTKTVLENKVDAVPSWGSFEKEHTFSCYSILQEILELKTPTSSISVYSLSSHVVGDSTLTSRGTRRRLNLDNRDQHCPARKTSRP